ncbi:NCOA1 protein, partial [Mystacornis crossleyi]|nr:NCOA1 protein [Mystacornis crossleyi]
PGEAGPAAIPWVFPAGMPQQSDPAFCPALSPGSPLMSPAPSPMLPPAPGYQSPELKSWQPAAVGNNGVFGQAGAAPAAPAGMYNNMSITVSMAGGGSGVQGLGAVAGGVPVNSGMSGINSMCSEQVSAA